MPRPEERRNERKWKMVPSSILYMSYILHLLLNLSVLSPQPFFLSPIWSFAIQLTAVSLLPNYCGVSLESYVSQPHTVYIKSECWCWTSIRNQYSIRHASEAMLLIIFLIKYFAYIQSKNHTWSYIWSLPFYVAVRFEDLSSFADWM